MVVPQFLMETKTMEFEKHTQEVINNYHKRMEKETALMRSLPIEEGMKRRDEFLLPVGKEVGQFLNNLIKGAQSKNILEVGTSYGYSTIWLAEAAKQTGGHIFSLEIDQEKSEYAKEQLESAGLDNYATPIVTDAVEWIQNTQQSFDFVLLDIWKELYVPALKAVHTKLNQEAFIVADNMIFPPNHKMEAMAYRTAVKNLNKFNTVLLPLGAGLEVSKLK